MSKISQESELRGFFVRTIQKAPFINETIETIRNYQKGDTRSKLFSCLMESLPQNAMISRKERAREILRRYFVFENDTVVFCPFHFLIRNLNDFEKIREIIFYHFVLAEPLVKHILCDFMFPNLYEGSFRFSNDDIENFIASQFRDKLLEKFQSNKIKLRNYELRNLAILTNDEEILSSTLAKLEITKDELAKLQKNKEWKGRIITKNLFDFGRISRKKVPKTKQRYLYIAEWKSISFEAFIYCLYHEYLSKKQIAFSPRKLPTDSIFPKIFFLANENIKQLLDLAIKERLLGQEYMGGINQIFLVFPTLEEAVNELIRRQ